MGVFKPRPYKKKCRITGKWVWVDPEPQEYLSKRTPHPIKAKNQNLK